MGCSLPNKVNLAGGSVEICSLGGTPNARVQGCGGFGTTKGCETKKSFDDFALRDDQAPLEEQGAASTTKRSHVG